MRREKEAGDRVEACPFPPGQQPPEKGRRDRMLDLYNGFKEYWIYLAPFLLSGIVLLYSLLALQPISVAFQAIPESWSKPYPEHEWHWIKEDIAESSMNTTYTHEGDIILRGDDVLRIENVSYNLDGVLLAKDNSSLILRNVELIIKEKTQWEPEDIIDHPYSIMLKETSRLEAVNTSIRSENHLIEIGFINSSRAYFEKCDLSKTWLDFHDDSSFEATDSFIGYCNLNGDAQGKIVKTEIWRLTVQPSIYTFYKRFHWESPQILMNDSTAEMIWVGVKNSNNVEICKPVRGHHGYWNIYDEFGIDGSAVNVTLRNSTLNTMGIEAINSKVNIRNVEGLWGVGVWNGTLNISNSSFIGSSAACEGTKTFVNNTVFNRFLLLDDSVSRIENSKIGDLHIHHFTGSAIFENVLIDRWSDIMDGSKSSKAYLNASLEGTIDFSEEACNNTNADVPLTRYFEVIVESDGKAVQDVSLELVNDDNETLREAVTGKDGTATFDLINKLTRLPDPKDIPTSFHDELVIKAKLNGNSVNKTVSFCSDTPIIINLPDSIGEHMEETYSLVSIGSASTLILSIIMLIVKLYK